MEENNIRSNDLKQKSTNKSIIYTISIIIIVVLVGLFITKLYGNSNEKNGDLEELNSIIKDKRTTVVYIYNSKKDNKLNKEIKKYLKEIKYDYNNYDIKNVSEKDYKNFLDKINISDKVFGTPAVLYIKDGVMYSNLINITNAKSVKQFIKDYKLDKSESFKKSKKNNKNKK